MANEVLEFQHVPKGALFEYEGNTYQKVMVPVNHWPNPKSLPIERSFAVTFAGDAIKLPPKAQVKHLF